MQGYASLEQSIKQQRAPVFQTIYEALNTSLATDGPLRGELPARSTLQEVNDIIVQTINEALNNQPGH